MAAVIGCQDVVDEHDRVQRRLGDGPAAFGREGWTNMDAEQGRFVSSRGIAVSGDAL